jgi:hypothetical protein
MGFGVASVDVGGLIKGVDGITAESLVLDIVSCLLPSLVYLLCCWGGGVDCVLRVAVSCQVVNGV